MECPTSVDHLCHCISFTGHEKATSCHVLATLHGRKGHGYSCHYQDCSSTIAMTILEQAGVAWYMSAAVALGPVRRLEISTPHMRCHCDLCTIRG